MRIRTGGIQNLAKAMASGFAPRICRVVCLASMVTLANGGQRAWPAELVGRITLSQVERKSQQAALNPYPGALGSLSVNASAPAMDDLRDVVITLEGAPEPEAAAATDPPRMEQVNQSFQPRVLAVAVGTVVEFPNLDPIFHNAFSYSKAKRFDLGKYGQGKTERVVFDKPGVVRVFCDIHSNMSAYIYVAPSRWVAQPDRKGGFALADVPPGEYKLLLWHPEFGTRSKTVKITEPKTTVDFLF